MNEVQENGRESVIRGLASTLYSHVLHHWRFVSRPVQFRLKFTSSLKSETIATTNLKQTFWVKSATKTDPATLMAVCRIHAVTYILCKERGARLECCDTKYIQGN